MGVGDPGGREGSKRPNPLTAPSSPLPLPLGSHLDTSLIGAEAGAEAPGRPPAGLVHDLPGMERAPPVSGLRPPHRGERAPEPAS